MTQNTVKIQGKFYPLQHEEFLSACQQLAPAQLMVLYFLRTLDPYGDGVEVSVSEIARQLSTESKKVHRSTVSRALKALDEKGFIDLELLKVKIKVLAGGLHCCHETTVLPTDNTVVSPQHVLPTDNTRDLEATRVISTQHARSSRNNDELKPAPDKDSRSSKTIKTYSDFKDSFSEGERESFLEFGKKKASQLPKPPELPLKWIEVNFKELHEQWKKVHSLNQNQTQKYNFPAYSESQHQMWYGQLQTVVKGAIESGNSFWLDQYLSDDFNNSWLNWAKVAREDVREFLASNPIPEGGHYGS